MPEGQDRMTFRRFMIFYILGVVFLNAVALAPTFTERLLASAVLLLALMPTYFYSSGGESGVPFMPVFGAIYGVYYGLPVFLLEEYSIHQDNISHSSMEKALLFAAIGLSILLVSYYRLSGDVIRKHLPRVSIHWDDGKARIWATLFCFVGLISTYLMLIIRIPPEFQQIVLFMVNLSKVGIGILFILQLRGRLNLPGRITLWLLFLPAYFLVISGKGALFWVLNFIIFMAMTYWTFKGKIPWKTAVAGAVLLVALMSVRPEFRRLTWEGIYADLPPVQKSVLLAEMAFSAGGDSMAEGFSGTLQRVSHLLTLAFVVETTPEVVPYWGGRTYLTLLWTPVPRIIYPDKPPRALGQEFGHRYGLLHPLDFGTSYNFAQLVEMYANFGAIGIIFGMFVIGVIYRVVHEVFCHGGAGEGGTLIGIVLYSGLVNMESNTSLVFGALLYPSVLLVLVSRLMRRRES